MSEAGSRANAVGASPKLSVLLPWPSAPDAARGMEIVRLRARAKLVDLYGGAHVDSQTWEDQGCRVTVLSVLITDDQAQDARSTKALGDFLRALPVSEEHGSVHVLLGRQLFTIAAGTPAAQTFPSRTEEP